MLSTNSTFAVLSWRNLARVSACDRCWRMWPGCGASGHVALPGLNHDTPRDLGRCEDSAGGGVNKGASAVLMKPLMKRVPADAPGRHATASRLAGERACLLRLVVHCPVLPYFHDAGLRVPRADRETDGVRHAGRRGPVCDLAA